MSTICDDEEELKREVTSELKCVWKSESEREDSGNVCLCVCVCVGGLVSFISDLY